MIEITLYGRVGQGIVSASQALAIAFEEQGITSHALPEFSLPFIGSPLKCFVRASKKQLSIKSPVEAADYSIVFDPSLIESERVIESTKPHGSIIINTSKDLGNVSKEHRVVCVDVDQVAKQSFSKASNVGILAAFVGATRVLQLKSLTAAVEKRFQEKNDILVVEKLYEIVRKSLT